MKHLWSVNEREKSPSSHSGKTHRCEFPPLVMSRMLAGSGAALSPPNTRAPLLKSQLSQEAKTELLDRRAKTADSSCNVVSGFWISTRGSRTQIGRCVVAPRARRRRRVPNLRQTDLSHRARNDARRAAGANWLRCSFIWWKKRAVKCKTHYKVVFTKGQILHNCCCFNYIINTPDKDVLCLPPWK